MHLNTADLASAVQLTQHLASFHNNSFPDASCFSKIDVGQVRYWCEHAKAFLAAQAALGAVAELIEDHKERFSNLIAILLRPLKHTEELADSEWMQKGVAGYSELCLMAVDELLSLMVSLDKGSKLTIDDTQETFRDLREVCVAIDAVIKHQWPKAVWNDQFDPVMGVLKRLLVELARVCLVRLEGSLARDGEVSFAVLEMLESDLSAAKLIGLWIPDIDLFAIKQYE